MSVESQKFIVSDGLEVEITDCAWCGGKDWVCTQCYGKLLQETAALRRQQVKLAVALRDIADGNVKWAGKSSMTNSLRNRARDALRDIP